MSTQIQQLRGTTSQNADFTGREGVLTIDTEIGDIHVHGGNQKGGIGGAGILMRALTLSAAYSERNNWVINGDFMINQRGVTSPRSVANGVYGYDRWKGNANGLEQVIETLPFGEYTLTWSGGGTGYIGSNSGTSPLKAASAGGNVSIVVPKTATNVSLVAGDATKQDPWLFVQRAPAIEMMLCQRYYERGVTYQGGWTAQFLVGQSVPFKVTKRASPTLTFNLTDSVNVSNPRAQDPNTNDFILILDVPSGATTTRSLYRTIWTASAEL